MWWTERCVDGWVPSTKQPPVHPLVLSPAAPYRGHKLLRLKPCLGVRCGMSFLHVCHARAGLGVSQRFPGARRRTHATLWFSGVHIVADTNQQHTLCMVHRA